MTYNIAIIGIKSMPIIIVKFIIFFIVIEFINMLFSPFNLAVNESNKT